MNRTISKIILLLALAGLVGAYYGSTPMGVMVGAVVVTAWQLRGLSLLQQFLQTWDKDLIPEGNNLWAQIFAKLDHIKQRSRWHKRRYAILAREVRKSTDALPDAGIVLGDDDEVLFSNAAAQHLVGIHSRKDRGQRVNIFIRNPAFVEYLKERRYEKSVEIPSPLSPDDWLSCQIVPYGGDQRLLMIRDITERKRLTKMRQEFVANASHELRTPLTVISGYLEALVDDPNAPTGWVQPLQQMQEQTSRMTDIVNELLQLSRLESRGIADKANALDICGMLVAAKKSLPEALELPELNIECQSTGSLMGEAMEIESLIQNLLNNAIRHTPRDKCITLGWRDTATGAELYVSDTGEGVAKEYLPRLTERFFRVDQGRGRATGGTGLGLAIVKHVVGRHEGDLEFESEPGQGLTVTCRFPASRVSRQV